MDFVATDLVDHGEIGRGAFGSVNRMTHRQTSTEMAVKRIRSTVDEREQKRLLMDLDVVCELSWLYLGKRVVFSRDILRKSSCSV